MKKLLEDIDLLQGGLAHEEQLVPEPVKFSGLGLVEDESLEVGIFTMEESQGDDLIDGDDFRVTERDRKKGTELVEGRLEAFPRFTGRVRDHGKAVTGDKVVVAPLTALDSGFRIPGDEARARIRPFLEHAHLHAARFLRGETTGHDKFGSGGECGGNGDFHDGGGFREDGFVRLLRTERSHRRREERAAQGEILLEIPAHRSGQLRRRGATPRRERSGQIGSGGESGGLAEEVPGPVRIADENVGRNVLREIPGRFAVTEAQIHRGEVATVIPFAWPNDERDDLPCLDAHVLERPERYHRRPFRFPAREDLGGVTAT